MRRRRRSSRGCSRRSLARYLARQSTDAHVLRADDPYWSQILKTHFDPTRGEKQFAERMSELVAEVNSAFEAAEQKPSYTARKLEDWVGFRRLPCTVNMEITQPFSDLTIVSSCRSVIRFIGGASKPKTSYRQAGHSGPVPAQPGETVQTPPSVARQLRLLRPLPQRCCRSQP